MTGLRALIALAALLIAACASPGPAPSAGDCLTMRLWSNGWHANLALPAEAFDDDNPLREFYPEADYFLIGWGARDFYIAEEAGFFDGVRAVFPGPSALQVFAADEPVEETVWRGSDLAEFAVSREGARAMTASIADGLRRGEDGGLVVLAEGRVAGASDFFTVDGRFHFFNMCNHWAARRLREAGVRVAAPLSFTVGGLMRAVRRTAPPACPADAGA